MTIFEIKHFIRVGNAIATYCFIVYFDRVSSVFKFTFYSKCICIKKSQIYHFITRLASPPPSVMYGSTVWRPNAVWRAAIPRAFRNCWQPT